MFVYSDLSESQFPDEEEAEIPGAEDDITGEHQQLLLKHVSSLLNFTLRCTEQHWHSTLHFYDLMILWYNTLRYRNYDILKSDYHDIMIMIS